MNAYKAPDQTRIEQVHLKITRFNRSIDFYCNLLGFEITTQYGDGAVFISIGRYHPIGLNTWHSKNQKTASKNYPGLFHTVILYPSRRFLALFYKWLFENRYPLTDTYNYVTSEALYLDNPDENGVELYYNRLKKLLPFTENGDMDMFLKQLNSDPLLQEINSL